MAGATGSADPGQRAVCRCSLDLTFVPLLNGWRAHGSDDGETAIGSVILLDVPDMGAARAFMEKEPFCSNGVYQNVTFHRWRFGRVMDRFK
jgi:YCII-related domain